MAVTRFEITEQFDFAGGQAFPGHGSYLQIDGRVFFEVDADEPANQTIVDLPLAANTPDNRVTFSADFSLVTPKDSERGVGKLLVDVPNRGNRLTAPSLHRVLAVNPEDRVKPGDGFLCRHGFSYLAIGWQWDAEGEHALRLQAPMAQIDGRPVCGPVMMKLQSSDDRSHLALIQLGQTAPPYPVADVSAQGNTLYVKPHENAERVVIPRGDWRFARVKDGAMIESERHIWLKDGFKKGLIYELVYETHGAPVVGAGLLAVRDATACLKYGDPQSPVPHGFKQTYGYGVSQTGRFLRQFLWDGLNKDDHDRKVFDGLWLHIAGAQRGDFNFRFAQPTVATVPSLGQRFPFANVSAKDLFSERQAGLLDNLAPEMRPKIVISNTSFEYWRGDASLAHILGDSDLPADDSTRIYHIAGTHHIGGILVGGKQITEVAATGLQVAMPLNVVNPAPVSRALIMLLDEWVTNGIAPPPSRHPRLDDGTAVPRESVLEAFSFMEDIALLAPDKLVSIRCQVAQPGNEQGIVRQPVDEGEAYPCYVSAVNEDLNEVTGIQLPDLACPLGIHTGWNPRARETGAEDQAAIFAGFTRFFSKEEIISRYGSESGYLAEVGIHVDSLIADRFVLAEDRDWMMQLARDRFRAATAAG